MDEAAARAAFEQALQSYHQDFGTFFLARLFGLTFAYEDDTCIVTGTVRDFMFNPQGSLHGGVISFILDVSMGHLLQKTYGAGTTLEMKVQFLRPPTVGEIRAVGRFIKRGRSINYLESRLTQNGADVAAATSTWMRLSAGS
ncbi:MAG TPA: PaaI family thioesterase [Candidatus Sulfotelmatobacter sp.]|nr:PaaI family thioesterase [Candidatus Sulfotelmatobacter sp.]